MALASRRWISSTTIEGLLRQVDAGSAWNTPKAQILPGDGRLFMSMLAASNEPLADGGEVAGHEPGQCRQQGSRRSGP